MNILTLYYICYSILAIYMLDSGQEPSYNLSKNLLLMPRILKLMKDMVDDSTPLICMYVNLGLQLLSYSNIELTLSYETIPRNCHWALYKVIVMILMIAQQLMEPPKWDAYLANRENWLWKAGNQLTFPWLQQRPNLGSRRSLKMITRFFHVCISIIWTII